MLGHAHPPSCQMGGGGAGWAWVPYAAERHLPGAPSAPPGVVLF
jgi:hypothetical protein